jgi:hypothetical protein
MGFERGAEYGARRTWEADAVRALFEREAAAVVLKRNWLD